MKMKKMKGKYVSGKKSVNESLDKIMPLNEKAFPMTLEINSYDKDVALGALKKIKNKKHLAAIACNAKHEDIAMAALEKISDAAMLTIVYLDSLHSEVQTAAYEKLHPITSCKDVC